MAKITVVRFLLLLMVLELTLVFSTWGWRRRRCSSTKPIRQFSWVNQWREDFTYECNNGYSLSYWYSIHRNCQEDRIHHFKCRSGPIAGGNCQWLRFANDYDGSFIFKCPNDGVLTGVESEFSGQHNDRRFRFRCCHKSGYHHYDCRWSRRYENTWDDPLDYTVTNGYSIVAVHSKHDNSYEDRRWKFEICKIQ